MKAAKEEKEGAKDTRYLFNFNFISGFNNLSEGGEILPEFIWNDRVSQTRCKNIRYFRTDKSKFGVLVVGDKSIWCLWYRLLLAETVATGGRVSQHAAKRTHGRRKNVSAKWTHDWRKMGISNPNSHCWMRPSFFFLLVPLSLFRACTIPYSCQGPLGTSALHELTFILFASFNPTY